jgi:hypothetical protein
MRESEGAATLFGLVSESHRTDRTIAGDVGKIAPSLFPCDGEE